jgi:hypothetical protein
MDPGRERLGLDRLVERALANPSLFKAAARVSFGTIAQESVAYLSL